MLRTDIIELMRAAIAVAELDTPGKRGYFSLLCDKHGVDSEKFLAEIGAEIRDLEFRIYEDLRGRSKG